MSSPVSNRNDQLDSWLEEPFTTLVRFCGDCGCLFIVNQDGLEYLWVDRYAPTGHDDDSDECACHTFEHVTPEG